MNRKDFLNAKMIGQVPEIGVQSTRINVLSVQQPWAAALFFGKGIENRSWSTDFLGPICIHASAKDDGAGWVPCVRLMGKAANKSAFLNAVGYRGAIIGVKNLIAVAEPGAGMDKSDPWAVPGQHHWLFDDQDQVLFKRPLACKGMLKVWSVDARVISETLADTGEAGIPPWLRDEIPVSRRDHWREELDRRGEPGTDE